MSKILVIEQQSATRTLIENRFGNRVTVESAPNLKFAVSNFRGAEVDLLIWDMQSSRPDHADFTKINKKLLLRFPHSQTVIIADTDEPRASANGSFGGLWLRVPIDEEELLAMIETVVQRRAISHRPPLVESQLGTPIEFEGILAVSLAMRSVLQQITEAASVDVPVLISGETGTGKDLVAAAIHSRSKRSEGPYLPVNMGAISTELIASELFGHEKGAYTGASETRAGFFEQVQSGTIFLDEITTMDERTQVSLLRVLETKTIRRVRGDRDIRVDARVIAATNENIEDCVKAGRFREDLYYRLDVFRIHVPPLRERHGGISLLTDHFVSRFDDMYEKDIRVVSPDTYRLLRHYQWPGNVRELKNVVQRAVLLAKGSELTPDLLPARIRTSEDGNDRDPRGGSPIHLGMSLGEVEREFIKLTLDSVSGNKLKAASVLGISRRALYNKLKRHGLL